MAETTPRNVKGDSYYGKTARNYEIRRTRQQWWHVENTEMEALLDKLPRALRVVDIPFGTGRFVPMYLERGYQIHGLDASEAMVAQAGEILGDSFKKCSTSIGSATELPYEDGEFDLLVSTRFLRDIIIFKHAKQALAEFARVTKSHAIIQLGQTTNAKGAMPKAGEAMGSKMSAKQIENLLTSVGFTIVEKRLVKSDEADNSEIYHVLCKKT